MCICSIIKRGLDWHFLSEHLFRTKSGLTQACLDSPHSLSSVEEAVLSYIKKWIPEKRTGVLAGNSVHVDRVFLMEHMPSLVDHLHYR